MCPFRSRITPSRSVFRVILVPRDPWDNLDVTVRARSFVTTHLTETVFRHRMTHRTLANALIQCLRWKTSPRTSESDKYWPLWTEKSPGHVDVISDLVIFDFKIFFLRLVMVKAVNFQYLQPSPNDLTAVHRWLGGLRTLFIPVPGRYWTKYEIFSFTDSHSNFYS